MSLLCVATATTSAEVPGFNAKNSNLERDATDLARGVRPDGLAASVAWDALEVDKYDGADARPHVPMRKRAPGCDHDVHNGAALSQIRGTFRPGTVTPGEYLVCWRIHLEHKDDDTGDVASRKPAHHAEKGDEEGVLCTVGTAGPAASLECPSSVWLPPVLSKGGQGRPAAPSATSSTSTSTSSTSTSANGSAAAPGSGAVLEEEWRALVIPCKVVVAGREAVRASLSDMRGSTLSGLSFASLHLLRWDIFTALPYKCGLDANDFAECRDLYKQGRKAEENKEYNSALRFFDDARTRLNAPCKRCRYKGCSSWELEFRRDCPCIQVGASLIAWRAWSLVALAKYEEALVATDEAIRMWPHVDVHATKAAALIALKRYEEAVKESNSAMMQEGKWDLFSKMSPSGIPREQIRTMSEILANKCFALHCFSKTEEALATLELAETISPDFPDIAKLRQLLSPDGKSSWKGVACGSGNESTASATMTPSQGSQECAEFLQANMGPLRTCCNIQEFQHPKYKGCGSFSVVFKARHPFLDGFLCLKILITMETESDSATDLWRRKISEMGNLSRLPCNSHILTPLSAFFGSLPTTPEWARLCKPLDKWCSKYKLDKEDWSCLFKQVLEALGCLARNSIVHRDLKSSNILVSGTPHDLPPHIPLCLRIIDFGISIRTTGEDMCYPLGNDEARWGCPLTVPPEIAQLQKTLAPPSPWLPTMTAICASAASPTPTTTPTPAPPASTSTPTPATISTPTSSSAPPAAIPLTHVSYAKADSYAAAVTFWKEMSEPCKVFSPASPPPLWPHLRGGQLEAVLTAMMLPDPVDRMSATAALQKLRQTTVDQL
ncbi:hypothetical protein Pelo_6794 [Pelomyxa schiedti]|nr:hypothetical protein Pelo_6794 [Pelomyxa schiedti]